MTKTKLLTYLLAVAPTYFSCFAEPIMAMLIMAVGTLVGVILVGSLDADDVDLRDKLRDAWIIHIMGAFIVTLIQNL